VIWCVALKYGREMKQYFVFVLFKDSSPGTSETFRFGLLGTQNADWFTNSMHNTEKCAPNALLPPPAHTSHNEVRIIGVSPNMVVYILP